VKAVIFGLFVLTISQQLIAQVADDRPITAEKTEKYSLTIMANGRYLDQQGQETFDIIEGDVAYLAVLVETPAGQSVLGATPKFTIEGTTRMMAQGEISPEMSTDESGILEFEIIGGAKGLNQLTVSYGNNSASLLLNILSSDIKGFSPLPTLEGGLNWAALMEAELEYAEDHVQVIFPPHIAQQAGKLVKLTGYMLPLDADIKQQHFLLTSAPPSCYFHIPGGAAGVVEIFSETSVEASWVAIQLEGRLKLIETSESGIIYQLENATLIE
jgi:hypothetical protein